MGERAQIVLQAGIVLVVLGAAVIGMAASLGGGTPAVASPTPVGPDASLIASTVRTGSPTPTAEPTPSPTPAPTFASLPPTPEPPRLGLEAYSLNGRAYTGVEVAAGAVIVAPYDAELELHVYQLVGGEIREFADVPGVPEYPYVILNTPDRILKLRPGALGTDTELLARASRVKEGDPLFRVIGSGRSSWYDFYDATIPFQMVVSLETAAAEDLDAAPFIKAR